ncbi:MAG: (4Fe-4S)-binding protein [Flavitalea sp.]
MQKTFKYTNGEVTIVWQPEICQHTGICFRGLPQVFDPRRRPWIEPLSATTEKIVAQVKECPSHALSFYFNEEEKAAEDS